MKFEALKKNFKEELENLIVDFIYQNDLSAIYDSKKNLTKKINYYIKKAKISKDEYNKTKNKIYKKILLKKNFSIIDETKTIIDLIEILFKNKKYEYDIIDNEPHICIFLNKKES